MWFRVAGHGAEPGKLPLVRLHDGPGAAHDDLEPLEALAETGRRVVFYDQLGCGRSAIGPQDLAFWTVELSVDEEPEAYRAALDAFMTGVEAGLEA
jgi:L-proline amide hydrolase